MPGSFPKIECSHAPPCGGCALLHLTVAEQLEWKRRRLADALARFPALRAVEVRSCVAAPSPWGYRTRAKLAVDRDSNRARARIGLFRTGSHEVLDLPRCRVVHPALLPIVDALRDLIPRSEVAVRHLDLRWSLAESRAHVTLVAPGANRTAALRLAEALVAVRTEVSGAGLRGVEEPVAVPRAVGGMTTPLIGSEFLFETLGTARFRLSPGAFFQADPAAAERLHAVVREWLADPALVRPAHLIDLYAGVGAFAVSLAGLADRTTAVESVPAAAADAEASASASGVSVGIVRSQVERFLSESDVRADLAVLDPPRRGAPSVVLRALGRIAPVRAAYVACDPDTLARDLDALAPLGLSARAVVPVDLFSLADQVEAVALLERTPVSWRPHLRWRSPDGVAADKPAILPTHPQDAGGVSLRDAVRGATGIEDLQPVHRLDVGTSGPVLFARGAVLKSLGTAFESGAVQKEYLALVRGVPRRSGRIADRGRHDEGDRGTLPVTRYRLEAVVGGYGFVRVRPETGRRHQIRRHLASIGHPVLGDDRYGDTRANRYLAETCALSRPFLHLASLVFDPPGGVRVSVDAPLAPELELVLDRLRAIRSR